MREYVNPSRAMIIALEKIGQIEKPVMPHTTEEDELFEGHRLRFPLGTVIAVSRHDAENVIWTKRQDKLMANY